MSLILMLLLLGPPIDAGQTAAKPLPEEKGTRETPSQRALGLRCIEEAYPDHFTTPRAVVPYLLWRDGTKMPWDDGVKRPDHAARLAGGDLQEQMSQPYPAGATPAPPPVDFDPGRIRYEPFFRKMYGATREAVEARLTPVRWLDGGFVGMTTTNGAATALERVVAELRRLPPAVREKVHEASGGYHWRRIKGTKRLSMHSFGIAVDVGVKHSDYWRWRRPDRDGHLRWRNRIPPEVVAAFERHGFIWGGRWYHFDTMHFEYRPELLQEGCVGRP